MNNCSSFISPKVGVQNRQRPGNGRRRTRKQQPKGNSLRPFRLLDGKPVIRRFSLLGSISTDATGKIALATGNNTSSVEALFPTFPTFSQNFQQYRVRRLIMRLTPTTTNATSSTGPFQGSLLISRFWGNLVPANVNGIVDDPLHHNISTLEEHTIETNYMGFPDGQLWTATNAVVTGGYQYGFAFASNSAVLLATSSVIFALELVAECEFIGPI